MSDTALMDLVPQAVCEMYAMATLYEYVLPVLFAAPPFNLVW